MTIACYQATQAGLACGQCDSCYLRQKGFSASIIDDPTQYVSKNNLAKETMA